MEEQGIVTVEPGALSREAGSGAMALARMSGQEFDARLAMVTKAQERVRALVKAIMREGEDFGTIPGTKKPTLLKPGSEKLCAFYGLVATYEVATAYGDGAARPWITVEVKAVMRLGSADGPIVGEGLGSANSSESKHRWRTAKRTCPSCGSVGAIARSNYEDKDTGERGWYCRDCKEKFALADPAIVDQALGRIENEDPGDVENTCLKMAKKRAYIDGTLTTTATSGFFTQDLEDSAGEPTKAAGESRVAEIVNAPTSREPGSDDGPAADPYEKHGVEPPARKRAGAKGADANKAPCPQCGKPAFPSKYPDKGSHYCGLCHLPFTPGGAK